MTDNAPKPGYKHPGFASSAHNNNIFAIRLRAGDALAVWFCAIAVLLLLAGCGHPAAEPPQTFALYMPVEPMSGQQIATADIHQIVLQDTPVLSDADIVSYRRDTHEIELTDAAYQRLMHMGMPAGDGGGVPVFGKGFVVCVGNERIYAGAFWTLLSSLSYDGYVLMLPLDPARHVVSIERGYPASQPAWTSDQRNDPRIFRALDQTGKLRPPL